MIKYFFALILIAALTSPCVAQKVKPALNLGKGSTYYLASASNSENIQIANGRQIKLNLSLRFRMAFKVTGVTDSVYTIEASYQSLSVKMLSGDLGIEMSSDRNDSTDVASQIVKAMINKSFSISIAKSGKVVSVNSVENMIDSAFERFPQIEAEKKMRLKNQFIQTFGAKALTGSLEICTAVFPQSAVAKNDNWLVKTKSESITTADLQTTYQLIDMTGNSYQIHGDGVISNDTNAGVSTIDGLPVKYKLSGFTLSDIRVDKTSGWVTELKLRQLTSGSVQIQDSAKVPGGLTIPIVIKIEQITTAL